MKLFLLKGLKNCELWTKIRKGQPQCAKGNQVYRAACFNGGKLFYYLFFCIFIVVERLGLVICMWIKEFKSNHHLVAGYTTCKHAKQMPPCVCFVGISRKMQVCIAKCSHCWHYNSCSVGDTSSLCIQSITLLLNWGRVLNIILLLRMIHCVFEVRKTGFLVFLGNAWLYVS